MKGDTRSSDCSSCSGRSRVHNVLFRGGAVVNRCYVYSENPAGLSVP